jgi:hypothetical protein
VAAVEGTGGGVRGALGGPALLDAGALRPGLTAQAAADILYALASLHTHQLLRRHCRWTTQRYRTWLTRVVAQELLADTQG